MRRSTFSHRTSQGRGDANGRQLVACLAGDGVGPELMAEATRALARVSKLHSLPLDELHLPFAGEAVTRYGHALPLSTRAAYLKADAILVATPHEPAVEAIKADLELVWRVTHVHVPARGDALVFGAVSSAPPEPAIERAGAFAHGDGGDGQLVERYGGDRGGLGADDAGGQRDRAPSRRDRRRTLGVREAALDDPSVKGDG